jgi:hypothetical protein
VHFNTRILCKYLELRAANCRLGRGSSVFEKYDVTTATLKEIFELAIEHDGLTPQIKAVLTREEAKGPEAKCTRVSFDMMDMRYVTGKIVCGIGGELMRFLK